MSEMSQGLSNWLLKYHQPSVMHQLVGLYGEEKEATPSTACQEFPERTKQLMVRMAEESTTENREAGAAIRKGYELGPPSVGTERNIKIIRTGDTIGTYHTHPNGFTTPSTYDIMEAIAKKDQIMCTGTSDRWGNKIACYTPVEPYWTEYHNKIVQLLKDIRAFNNREIGKNYRKGVPLKRLLKYIGSPSYQLFLRQLKPIDKPKLLKDLDESLDREYKQRERVEMARRAVTEARIAIEPLPGKVTMAESQGYPQEIRDAKATLKAAEAEAARREAMLVIEKQLLEDTEAATEIARARSQADPNDVAEGMRQNKEAISLLSLGQQLEKRRQELVDQINEDIKFSNYKQPWRHGKLTPMALEKCHLVWETGLFEDLPYEF